ncbi:hypothetical protein RF11_00250 [Thelohanellus kitauei]|uniref:Uncharacterized protein n=1 Tax=Thelohanellus kitauei TaxID=669202 RepID=A0A0C2M754_THEKT|nr:hypothetical protein RF11_00250 [Thelohanellus kitauei]
MSQENQSDGPEGASEENTNTQILQEESFTRKTVQKVPLERNSRCNMDLRQNFCRTISNISDDRILFIDKTGINLHSNPHYGYSPLRLTETFSESIHKGVNI